MNRYVAAVAAVALPVIVAAIAFAACGGSEGAPSAGPAPSVPATTATSPFPDAPTEASTTEPAPPELEDGRHFGYIKSVDVTPQPGTLVLDLAYLLTGDEANREAAKRGFETPVSNDYFIVNDNPRLRTLRLSSDLEVRLLDWTRCCDTFFDGNFLRFAASFERTKHTAGNYRGRFSAYTLTTDDGIVVAIEEHYFP